MTTKKLSDRLALVTGGSRGIGEAIAMAFAREGARVILSSRKQEGLESAAARVNEAHPGMAFAKACHMGRTDDMDALLAWAEEKGPGLPQVLVNNAATNPYFGPLLGADPMVWDKTFEVNIKGPFELTRRLASRWIDRGLEGAIVNIASVAGLRAAPFQGIYGMTKAALISLTMTLAVELASAHIRVNAIAPGLVDTRFASTLIHNPDVVGHFTQHTALQRYAQPHEIAGAAVFLASREAGYITGQTLCVDGGYTIA